MTRRDLKELIFRAGLAGFLIALAGCIFLMCQTLPIGWNRIVGALMFSVGLYGVCELQAKLFTGVIGNVDSKRSIIEALIILVFNIIIAVIIGIAYRFTIGENQIFENIVNNQSWYKVFFESCICGSLIYIGVTLYKQTHNPLSLVLCVMAFILSGSLHSIACSFYIVLGNIYWKSFLYLFIIIIGNSAGALLVRFLYKDRCAKNIS